MSPSQESESDQQTDSLDSQKDQTNQAFGEDTQSEPTSQDDNQGQGIPEGETSALRDVDSQEALWILDALRQEEKTIMKPLFDPKELKGLPKGRDW